MIELETSVSMINLGCPKNQIDGEIMLKRLEDGGFQIKNNIEEAKILIINTCGFIEAAQREAIDTILSSVELKETTKIEKIIVTGCLAERYSHEVMREIPEVDAVIGIGANADICEVCRKVMEGDKYESFPPKEMLPLDYERLVSTPCHWAYIKISDGCNNRCSYCAIPAIRGKLRSRKIKSIVEEAKSLIERGVKEIIIVAQDTTRYGADLYKKPAICDLLRELCKIDGDFKIRLLYCYPEMLTDEFLELIASEPKIINYIDLPIQHCNKNILRRMNRAGSYETLTDLLGKIRKRIPDVCLRTTLMVGFPGEGEEEFEELVNFIKEVRFDRLGCFAFSPEEGTAAAEMADQVDDDVKQRRLEILMQEQFFVSEENNKDRVGKVYECIVDGFDEDEKKYFARSYFDAPEIDSVIKFGTKRKLLPGTLVKLKIIGYDDYDLIGELL